MALSDMSGRQRHRIAEHFLQTFILDRVICQDLKYFWGPGWI